MGRGGWPVSPDAFSLKPDRDVDAVGLGPVAFATHDLAIVESVWTTAGKWHNVIELRRVRREMVRRVVNLAAIDRARRLVTEKNLPETLGVG